MSASTASTRGGFGRTAKMLILGAMVACLGVFALAGSAKAAPVSMDLTNGQLNLGFAFKGAEILPAPQALGESPLPDLWVARNQTVPAQGACLANIGGPGPGGSCGLNPPNATVSGDINEIKDITIEANEFQFPIMVVPNPLDGSPVPVTIASTGQVTGSFDDVSGNLVLSGPIEAQVLVGLTTNPLGQYCALPLVGLELETRSNDDFPGVPFTEGFSGEGALTGTYNITDDSTPVGGADCGTVNSVSKGLGSIWVSNGIEEPPVCPEFTTGIPPECEPIPCPAGFTGNEPDCVQLKARIGSVTVSGPSNIRKGKPAKYTVRIRNAGNAQATGVRLIVQGRGIKVNSPVGTVNAGATRTVSLRVRATRTGKVKAAFRVASNNGGNKTVNKTIRVR